MQRLQDSQISVIYLFYSRSTGRLHSLVQFRCILCRESGAGSTGREHGGSGSLAICHKAGIGELVSLV